MFDWTTLGGLSEAAGRFLAANVRRSVCADGVFYMRFDRASSMLTHFSIGQQLLSRLF